MKCIRSRKSGQFLSTVSIEHLNVRLKLIMFTSSYPKTHIFPLDTLSRETRQNELAVT